MLKVILEFLIELVKSNIVAFLINTTETNVPTKIFEKLKTIIGGVLIAIIHKARVYQNQGNLTALKYLYFSKWLPRFKCN